MSIDATANGQDLDLWHVQVGNAVRTMTLDELDQAFQSGMIDERTMVLKAGSLSWTTLGDVAGIDDQPNSIAPMATDIAPSSVVIPTHAPPPAFDLSVGTEELMAFKPKRRVGRALGVMAAVAVAAGVLFGLNSLGIDGIESKVASVTALVKGNNAEAARAAAVAPPPVAEPESAAPPPAPVDLLPSATPPSSPGVSLDSLPAAPTGSEKTDNKVAKAEKKKTKKTAPPPRRKKAGKKLSNDPTQRGAGQFDPLNGNL